jgi:hypothetical protein
MKATTVQLPVRLTNHKLLSRAGPLRAGYPSPLVEGNSRRSWYAFFRSLRAAISGMLDSSAYDQISLGREVSVAFTSQGPVIYRYGRNSAVAADVTGEANRKADSPRES